MARFNLLHLLSDYFRNPVFRVQLDAYSYADQIKIFREEYSLDDDELAAVINHNGKFVHASVNSAVTTASVHHPPIWEGSLQAVTFGELMPGIAKPAPPGPAPGWPGKAWQTLESVTPSVSPAGPVKLALRGWNVDPAHFQFALEILGAQTPLTIAQSTQHPNGSWDLICAPLNLTTGVYSVVLISASQQVGLPSHLTNALTVL